jgi:hypothetical protein
MSFVARVGVRVSGLLSDAETTFEDLLQLEPEDDSAIAAAGAVLEARILGIQRRVADEWEETEGALHDLARATPGPERAAIVAKVTGEVERARDLMFEIDLAGKALLARKFAEAVRRKGARAAHDPAGPERCQPCQNLGRGTALEEWLALLREERRIADLGSPTPAELQHLEALADAYWRRHLAIGVRYHADWTEDRLEAAVRGRRASRG